jgi:hypothetical protein
MSYANYPLFCIVEEDMVSLGIQSYSLSGSSTKRIKISRNYYYYYARNARLHGSSAWMPSPGYTRPGQYLEVSKSGENESISLISPNALMGVMVSVSSFTAVLSIVKYEKVE